uniref:Uncharacterized protein n=1 Tax=Chlamydomonas euryale TaxID=1486919 RepID=A0A7R9V7H4_9CHLO|mmetsp:Transcript_23507/g.69845  ORF Transcript_23507/g.69845 Transcript_23507/m.69845 type:complete len:170 (+) Transcript_23507:1-510(+)
MTWADDVKETRVQAALSASREAYLERLCKARVRSKPIASPGSAVVLLGAAACHLLWRQHSLTLRNVQWRSMPLLRQFDELIFGRSGTRLGAKGSKPVSKAATGSNRSRQSAAKAASSAAQARAAAGQGSAPVVMPTPAQAMQTPSMTPQPAAVAKSASKRKSGSQRKKR